MTERPPCTLSAYLAALPPHQDAASVTRILCAIATAGKYVNAAIRMRDTVKDAQHINATGDAQSTLDRTADTLFATHLRATGLVRTIASEERSRPLQCPRATAPFYVAYDPYDGGSVGDANVTFGSIVGVWRRSPLHAPLGRDLVAAGILLYGPRVTLTIAVPPLPVATFELDEVGTFLLVRRGLRVAATARYIAPGNLRALRTDARYRTLFLRLVDRALTLRYTGALVTDVNHILHKGSGIFLYPADPAHPQGRLRLLYEGAPLAFLLAHAGGTGTTTDGTPLLQRRLTATHQRTTLLLGSRATVAQAAAALHPRHAHTRPDAAS